MMPSRGMGAVSPSKLPSKMPKGVKKARRDNTDFTEYKKGGKVAQYMKFSEKGKPLGMADVTKACGGGYMKGKK